MNTALGDGAAASNAVGDADTAVGSGALHFDLIGGNTAVGYRALYANTTGPLGTAIGISALQSNTTGQANTAGGAGALEANTVGSNNTAYGTVALTLNTVGNSNVAYGQGALMQNTTGSNNIAIGRQAAADVSAANSNNIHIGSLGTSSDNGVIRIGDAQSQGTFFAAGIRGATMSINDAVPVVIDSNGQLGTTPRADSRKISRTWATRAVESFVSTRSLFATKSHSTTDRSPYNKVSSPKKWPTCSRILWPGQPTARSRR